MYFDITIAKEAAKTLIKSTCEEKRDIYSDALIKEFTENFPNVNFNKKHDYNDDEKDALDTVWNNAKRIYCIEVYIEVKKNLVQKGAIAYERFKRHVNGRTEYNEFQDHIVKDIPKNISAGKLYKSYYYSVTGTEAKSCDCLELDEFQESIMQQEITKVKEYYSKNFR
jgi:hypothetical protein